MTTKVLTEKQVKSRPIKEFLTVFDLAKRWKLSPPSVYQLGKQGRLLPKPVKFGGWSVYHESTVRVPTRYATLLGISLGKGPQL